MIMRDIRTYDLRAVRRKVDKLTAELGKAKVKISNRLIRDFLNSVAYVYICPKFLDICLASCLCV